MIGTSGAKESSWFVDEAGFHQSYHGQLSCVDCHDDIPDRSNHPDPNNVAKTARIDFDSDSCLTCHDELSDDCVEDIHEIEITEENSANGVCAQCHDPHYDSSLGESPENTAAPDRCSQCHDQQDRLPELLKTDADCMACHQKSDSKDEGHANKISGFCFYCHGDSGKAAQTVTARKTPLIDESEFSTTPHAALDCMTCHQGAAAYNHGNQTTAACGTCHTRHPEKVTHDAHSNVSCEACHLSDKRVVRDAGGAIVWREGLTTASVHNMDGQQGQNGCGQCHYPGNSIGAAGAALPAKGIFCLPCHTGTFSVGDATTRLTLLLFGLGILMTIAVMYAGAKPVRQISNGEGEDKRAAGGSKVIPILKALFSEVLLQRRLYHTSRIRWCIHALIFYPFLLRFVFGIIGLWLSHLAPDSHLAVRMLDKNSPATALFFDITGLCLLLGTGAALLRSSSVSGGGIENYPRRDYFALWIIMGIVLIGFLLEGLRISMTQFPAGAQYAFVGYALARLFKGMTRISDVYPLVWYAHAIFTAGFFIYLPFSRLKHIIFAPILSAINAVAGSEKHH